MKATLGRSLVGDTHFPFLPPLAGAALAAGLAEAPPTFLASCLNLKLLFFLLIMTLNLSKSLRLALFALRAIFLAMALAVHFSFNLRASAAALARGKGNQDLLDGAGSCALEDLDLDGGESESLKGVQGAGEASGGSVNEHSTAVCNIDNHANLAKVFSKVHVGNSTWLDEVLEHLYTGLA